MAISLGLQQMLTIPQVRRKLPVLQRVTDEDFFDSATALTLEMVSRYACTPRSARKKVSRCALRMHTALRAAVF